MTTYLVFTVSINEIDLDKKLTDVPVNFSTDFSRLLLTPIDTLVAIISVAEQTFSAPVSSLPLSLYHVSI